MLHCCVYLFISIALVTVILRSCIHGCFHASLFASPLILQAECEALRAEAVKWQGDAKSLSTMQDVSTLNFICSSVIFTVLYANQL